MMSCLKILKNKTINKDNSTIRDKDSNLSDGGKDKVKKKHLNNALKKW